MPIRQALVVSSLLLVQAISGPIMAQKWLDMDNGLICDTYPSGYGTAFDVNAETDQIILAGAFGFNFDCDSIFSVVRWDGGKWLAYPKTLGLLYRSIKFYNGALFSNGFTTYQSNGSTQWSYNLIRLNESNDWETVSELTNNATVFRMREIDGELYGACSFSAFSNIPGALLFKWDGQTMVAPIDTIPETLAQCFDVCKYKNRLFVGGNFNFLDSDAHNFGEVVNKRVKGFGLPIQSTVWSFEEHEGLLYIGASIPASHFGTDDRTYLMTFDGTTLTPHPYQPNHPPRKMISYNGYLYIVGWFTEFNGEPAWGVVRMNQFGYEILNTDTMFTKLGLVSSLQMINDAIIHDDTLYITGGFSRIGPYDNLNCVAKLNMALSAPPTPLPVAGVQLFPNPSFGDVTLQAPEFFTEDALVHIHAVNGQLIRVDRWPAYTRRKRLERGALSRGVYLVELVADRQRHTLRWVVVD